MRNKVLIVEDQTMWSEIIERLVEESNLEPLFATIPEEALPIFQDNRNELACVTMDGSLRNKLDTLPLIAAMKDAVPVIGLSGNDADSLRRMEEAGCVKVFAKQTLNGQAFRETLQGLVETSQRGSEAG